MKERTLPLQQYARVLPAKAVYGGRVHAMHSVVGQDGPLAVVRALRAKYGAGHAAAPSACPETL